MEELKKSADAALSALKEAKAKQETTPETKKALEDKLNAIILDWNTQIGILESKAESDESQKADADTWRKTFDDFKKQYDAELQANQNEAQKEADAEQLKKSEETNKLATEITPKLGRYSTEELKALTKKSWKELWTDPKYIKTIQQIIIDTGAKHNSISDEILTNGIYGRGTIAGIKTLQKHLNTKYKANLGEPDGYIGPNTLKALLVIDGDKTRLEKIIEDHSGINPLPPESIKSTKTKKRVTTTGGVGTVGISEPAKGGTEEASKNGTTDSPVEIKLENNTSKWMTSLDELPKDNNGNFKRDKQKNISYLFKKDGIRYRFFDTGRVAVFKDIKKPGKMYDSKEIFYKLQNITDNKIIDNIDPYNNKIEKDYPTYLNELFKVMNQQQQEYYKKYFGDVLNIKCTSENPDIILHINKAEIRLKKSDYLKADGKTINYITINQIFLAYINKKIKENNEKNLDQNIQLLKNKLEEINNYTIDYLFPNTKDQKIKDFFALFSASGIEFDNIYSVSNDKNKVQFVFDISGINGSLINGKMRGKIDINDIIKNNKIDENLFKEQLKKNIINNLNNAKKPETSEQNDYIKYTP